VYTDLFPDERPTSGSQN